MKNADIGVVNFLPISNNTKCFSNKPFKYIVCNLPVIMSSFAYWMETFNDHAVFYDPKNPYNITDAINFLLEHPKKSMN